MPAEKVISTASLPLEQRAKSRIEERLVRDGNFPSPIDKLIPRAAHQDAPCAALGFDFIFHKKFITPLSAS